MGVQFPGASPDGDGREGATLPLRVSDCGAAVPVHAARGQGARPSDPVRGRTNLPMSGYVPYY